MIAGLWHCGIVSPRHRGTAATRDYVTVALQFALGELHGSGTAKLKGMTPSNLSRLARASQALARVLTTVTPRTPAFSATCAAALATRAAALVTLTASAAFAQNAAAASATVRPQLVVLITVDQLRPDYLERWGGEFTGGLARFIKEGALFPNGVHDHATTETAPGHASLGSGRHPRSTGIVRNDAGVQDPQAPLLDGARGGGASPYRFRGSSLFDWMRVRDPWARALSVSRKDRGAILPLGRANQSAFWYSNDGRFTTSRYYADTLPTWVNDFNTRDFIGALAGSSWTTLKSASFYPERDSIARENSGADFVFPHRLPDDAARRASLLTEYPAMDSLTVALALRGIEAMQLGGGTSTDFVGLSLSTTDAIGHRYGPDSRELHDHVLRVDQYLEQFIDSLFRLRDSSRIIFALSSDHGVAPYPELFFAGSDSTRGRMDQRPIYARARSSLATFGVEGDALQFESGLVVLDTARLRRRNVPVDSVVSALRTEFRAVPGVMRVDAVPELRALAERGDTYARRWYNAIPPDMDAVLTITLEPYHYWQTISYAMHGMPHDYDAAVPIAFLGPSFAPGKYEAAARTVDVAATLAAALGITPTEPIDGVVLREAFVGDLKRGTLSPARPITPAVSAPSSGAPRRP